MRTTQPISFFFSPKDTNWYLSNSRKPKQNKNNQKKKKKKERKKEGEKNIKYLRRPILTGDAKKQNVGSKWTPTMHFKVKHLQVLTLTRKNIMCYNAISNIVASCVSKYETSVSPLDCHSSFLHTIMPLIVTILPFHLIRA